MQHGCAAPPVTDPPSALLPVNGAIWRLTSMAGTPVSAEREATISFGSDLRVSGRSFINQYGGSYTCDDAGNMAFGPLAMTKMGGPPELMAMEQDFHQLLSRVDGYSFDGRSLVLTAGGGELLRFMQP